MKMDCFCTNFCKTVRNYLLSKELSTILLLYHLIDIDYETAIRLSMKRVMSRIL